MLASSPFSHHYTPIECQLDTGFMHLPLKPLDAVISVGIIVPILQMRRVRLRDVESFVQGHRIRKWGGQDQSAFSYELDWVKSPWAGLGGGSGSPGALSIPVTPVSQ